MTTKAVNDARHFDTIVLGAGISGLACASRLLHHHHFREKNRLLVIEARDRLGGRIASVNVHGTRLDTGANWIHGTGSVDRPNPLMKILPHKRYRELSGTVLFGLSDQDEASSVPDKHKSDRDENATYQSHFTSSQTRKDRPGKVIPSSDAGPLVSAVWDIIGELHEIATRVPADDAKRTSALQALIQTRRFRRAFEEIPSKYHQTFSALPQFIENMEAAPLIAQTAEHTEDSPGMSLLEYAIDDFDGDQVFLQDGYTAVIEELANDLVEEDLIQTETKVERIDWKGPLLTVETSRGTYTASNVVCTIPLGVLQHSQKLANANKTPPLFNPPLPEEKQNAIASLGFGTLDKICTLYSHAWWMEEPFVSVINRGLVQGPLDVDSDGKESFHGELKGPDSFTGFTNELPGITIHADGSTSTGPQRLSVMNLHALTGFPALSVFVSCSTAAYIESLTNEQASDILHRAFTGWFGREPPKPVAVHVTRWAQDEFSRGSYSHMITGLSEAAHRVEFQKPLNVNGAYLRFAGEHTSQNHFATAHGALLSGFREADAILQALKS